MVYCNRRDSNNDESPHARVNRYTNGPDKVNADFFMYEPAGLKRVPFDDEDSEKDQFRLRKATDAN